MAEKAVRGQHPMIDLVQFKKDVAELAKEGGDLYQKLADKYHITRPDAKTLAFPFVYGGKPKDMCNVQTRQLTRRDKLWLRLPAKVTHWMLVTKTACWLTGHSPDYYSTPLKCKICGRTIKVDLRGLRGLVHRIEHLESLVQVGVDIHMKGSSWVVICIAGKSEYVQFRRLEPTEARELLMVVRQMQRHYGQVVIDANPAFLEELRRYHWP